MVNLTYGLPRKYATFNTSGLKLEILDKDMKDLKFELTSK
jgi:hypothetical protein